MNNEALNRIDVLENRTDTIEDQKRIKGSWLMDKVYKAGSIIGLLVGIPGAFVGGFNLYDRLTADPNTDPKLCDTLHLSWEQEKKLVFKCRLALHNTGVVSDSVRRAYAYITSDILSAREPFKLEKVSISENGVSKDFPLGVKADDFREVEIQTGFELTRDKRQAFLEEGCHRLIFDFVFKEPQQKTVEYRFSIGQKDAEYLFKNGYLDTNEDPLCLRGSP